MNVPIKLGQTIVSFPGGKNVYTLSSIVISMSKFQLIIPDHHSPNGLGCIEITPGGDCYLYHPVYKEHNRIRELIIDGQGFTEFKGLNFVQG